MKKILVLALAIIAICITVSAVSADEGWSFSFGSNTDGGDVQINNNELKIQDEKFTIPDGYKELEKQRVVGEKSVAIEGAKVSTCIFEKGNDTVYIKVHFADGGIKDITYPDDAENKTIGGHNGALSTNEDNETVFDFESNEKLIEIIAPNEKIIEEILK